MEASNNSIIELQQFWLRNQSELVKTVQRVGQQSEEIKSLKKQYTILLHKKQRTEGSEGIELYFYVQKITNFDQNVCLFR